MNKARKETTDLIKKYLSEIGGYNNSVKMHIAELESLTDKEFDDLMVDFREGKSTLRYYKANWSDDNRFNRDKLIEVGKKYGFIFRKRLWITDSTTGQVKLTPRPYPFVPQIVRRQQQHLLKKVAITDKAMKFDETTGQPLTSIKTAAISFPEAMSLHNLGLHDYLMEAYKFRGGDLEAYRRLVRNIVNAGENSMESVGNTGSRANVNDLISNHLTAMHIKNQL